MNNQQLLSLVIKKLNLVPLEQEGGLVRNTYISAEKYQNRPVGTAIFYLLSGEAYSHLHKLTADEMWHHYLGDPIKMVAINEQTGELTQHILGKDIANNQIPQVLAPKNTWQGAKRLAGEYGFALVGTTMSPGYLESDFILGEEQMMLQKFPQHAEIIKQFTGKLTYQ